MRIRNICISLIMGIAWILLLSGSVFAAEPKTSFAGGDGTKENPYLISNARELESITELDKCYKLTQDIDMTGVKHTPIGKDIENPFTGTFDGNHHTISNVEMESDSVIIGFVGRLVENGEVKNLTLDGVKIQMTGDNGNDMYAGGIVGFNLEASIVGCNLKGKIVVEGQASSKRLYVGGIVVANEKGMVKRCSNNAKIELENLDGSISGSFIAGIVSHNRGIINECKNQGDITVSSAKGDIVIAGVVGMGDAETIKDCFNEGTIKASGNNQVHIGGIAGEIMESQKIQECFNVGKVEIGNAAEYSAYLGGIVGYEIGENTITENCYYLEGVKGVVENNQSKEKVTEVTLADAKKKATFKGFDFDTTWGMLEGYTYPMLRAFDNFSNTAKVTIGEVAATGSAVTPPVAVEVADKKLTQGVDYQVFFENNVAPGTAKAIIVGCNKYQGYVVKEFTITKTNIANLTVKLSSSSMTYNGKVRTPKVEVLDKNQTALKNGTDYRVSYGAGRKKVGTYSVVVTGQGKYTGSKKVTFTITPKATKVKKLKAKKKAFTMKWGKVTTQVTGYQVRYATSKKMKKSKTKTIKGAKKTSTTIKKLKSKKKYYVQVRTYKTVNGKKKYSSWSKKKTVRVK